MIPEPIARIAEAVACYPKQGNRHWRVDCPVCQTHGLAKPLLALWEGRAGSWQSACLSGKETCTPSALRVAIHSLLHAGKTEPLLARVPDTVTEGVLRAQRIFAGGYPIQKGDACDLFLRRYRSDFDPDLLSYLRWGPGNRPTEKTLIEGLVDPVSVFDPFCAETPILGVTLTYLRRNGEPVVIPGTDTPKSRHIGRRRGTACPLGPVHSWDGGTIAVSVRAGHTLALMQSSGHAYGLAVAKAEALPTAFLPHGERLQYEVGVADNGLALALAESLKESMEALGSSVYIDANKGGGREQSARAIFA